MTSFRSLKTGLTSTLITLLMTLQITACSVEEYVEPVADNSVSGTSGTSGTSSTSDGTDDIFVDISLSWVAPSEREDNTGILLSEIGGYKVYYGSTQGSYSNSVEINDASAASHILRNFTTGTYYFVMTTYDRDGQGSKYSPEVKIVI